MWSGERRRSAAQRLLDVEAGGTSVFKVPLCSEAFYHFTLARQVFLAGLDP